MSDLSSYLSTRNKQWSAKLWDGFIEAVQARLAPLEEQLDIQKEVADAIVARGLTVIEQELAPIVAQADQILDESTASINAKLARFEQKVTGGTVICMSNTAATLANAATINLTVVQQDREFFAPTPYLAISRATTVANWAVAKVNSFNRSTGALSITLEQVTGPGGPYSDWIITSLPGATLLQKDYYEKTLALRAQVAGDKVKTGEDRAAALAHKNDASDAAALSIAARAGSQQAFADMRKAIAVPLVPPTAPEIGQIWWDGNVVRVYDGVGFVPTVTASIGGLRFDEGTFAAGTDGIITIAGGFRFVMIWLNGALLYESRGDFVSTTPDITIPSATEGDEWKYWAYQAIDATDYDTKEQVNQKIATAVNAVPRPNTATVGAAIAGANGGASIADGDSLSGVLSGTSTLRRWTWGNIKSWMKAYLDGFYFLKPTGNTAQYLRGDGSLGTAVTSVAGRNGAVTVTKSDVGLSNVANTAPADLQVSNPTWAELNKKFNASGGGLTGLIYSDLAGNAPTGLQLRSLGSNKTANGEYNISGIIKLKISRGGLAEDYALGSMQYEENVGIFSQIAFRLNGFGRDKFWYMRNDGSFVSPGSIVGASKQFEIDHTVDPNNYDLRHTSTEAPEMLVEYRGVAKLTNGRVTVNVEDHYGVMTNTFKNLWADAHVHALQNQDGFARLKPSAVDGATFEIICEDETCSDTVSWLVMARRNDPYVRWSGCLVTDDEGKLIIEFEKPE